MRKFYTHENPPSPEEMAELIKKYPLIVDDKVVGFLYPNSPSVGSFGIYLLPREGKNNNDIWQTIYIKTQAGKAHIKICG